MRNNKKSLKKIKSNIYIYPILSTILFTLYWSLDSKIFSYLGLIVYLIPLMFLDIQKLIVIYYFLLPNISLFKMSENSLALSSIFMIIIFIKMIITKKFKIDIKAYLLLTLYLISSTITYLLAENNLIILASEIRIIIDILVVISIIYVFENQIDDLYDIISKAFIYGCTLVIISGMAYPILKGINLIGYRLEGINSDPNYFSLCLAFAISLLILKIYIKKSSMLDFILIFIFVIGGLMSLSRGFMVAMSINTLIILYLILLTSKISIKNKIIIFITIISISCMMSDSLSLLISNLIQRLTSEEYSGGSGRIDIWKEYIHMFLLNLKNLFFGVGETTNSMVNGHVQHNIFIEAISSKGIIGATIIANIYIYIYILVQNKINVSRVKLVAFIPIFTLCLGFLFLNGLLSDIGIMMIFLGIYACNIYNIKLT